MRVAEAIAEVATGLGVDTVFGVVGSGNFHVTNALTARGVSFVAARHEGGATTMADAWARTTGRTGLVSVHQGPGFTNALTGITEAAKSRTPLVVLAADVAAAAVRSNFRIDMGGLAAAVGAVPERIHSPQSAIADTVRAFGTAARERRTVVLAMPLDVQAADCPPTPSRRPRRRSTRGARAARRYLRCPVRNVGGGEGPVPWQPMGPGRQWGVRLTASHRTDRRCRPHRGLGLRAQHVDNAPWFPGWKRHDDRSGGSGRGRHRWVRSGGPWGSRRRCGNRASGRRRHHGPGRLRLPLGGTAGPDCGRDPLARRSVQG